MGGLRNKFYRSGAMHRQIRALKDATYRHFRSTGAYNSTQYPSITTPHKCVSGHVSGSSSDGSTHFKYQCSNVDLAYFLPHADLGSERGEGSSVWGWTSSTTGREFAVVGQADGAAFVEVDRVTGALRYVGRLPQPKGVEPLIWREIRVLGDYAIIGSEAENHGVQIFDMNKLLDLEEPLVLNPEKDVTSVWKEGLPLGKTHNIVVNEEMGYAVAVGALPREGPCKSGLIFIDVLDNPENPTSPGCNGDDGYVHDAECLPYKGPDKRFLGRDICYGYNENSLTIYDVTDRSNSTIISITSYDGATYTHQGAVLNPHWQHYLIMDDEYDEHDKVAPADSGHPISYIWDISDLTVPKQTGIYRSPVRAVDHNQYVVGNLVFQSNYGSGLRILDVSSVPEDPTGAGIEEVGFFDIYPEDDSVGGKVTFVGTWASYPKFGSGWVIINTIERGIFSVRYTGKKHGKPEENDEHDGRDEEHEEYENNGEYVDEETDLKNKEEKSNRGSAPKSKGHERWLQNLRSGESKDPRGPLKKPTLKSHQGAKHRGAPHRGSKHHEKPKLR
ncbi:hypothetical protein BDZ91DRAFT_667480 [Kalaharituber pfeilii]|nr:hypothetical protein BDZ91DRAFT_667480 [Kalaharituber pfeilii]